MKRACIFMPDEETAKTILPQANEIEIAANKMLPSDTTNLQKEHGSVPQAFITAALVWVGRVAAAAVALFTVKKVQQANRQRGLVDNGELLLFSPSERKEIEAQISSDLSLAELMQIRKTYWLR